MNVLWFDSDWKVQIGQIESIQVIASLHVVYFVHSATVPLCLSWTFKLTQNVYRVCHHIHIDSFFLMHSASYIIKLNQVLLLVWLRQWTKRKSNYKLEIDKAPNIKISTTSILYKLHQNKKGVITMDLIEDLYVAVEGYNENTGNRH
jgi:hypothetical protein